MKRIELATRNQELLKSLIYRLERELPVYRYILAGDGVLEAHAMTSGTDPDEAAVARIREMATEFLGKAARIADRLKPEILFTLPGRSPAPRALQDSAIRSSKIDGVRYFDGQASRALQLLDRIFEIFAERNQCEFRNIPTLVSRSDLEALGYLPKDSYQVGTVHCEDPEYSRQPGLHGCLTPAVCLTLYPSLKDSEVRPGSDRFTFSEKAFRREHGKFSSLFPLERVWEFHVRELVFFGGSALRNEIFEKFKDFLKELATRLELNCQMNAATDLFFNPRYSAMAVDQLINKRKYELNFLHGDQQLAIASINFHLKQFTEAYGIRGEGEDFQSFCVAFGLERWLQAMLITYDDPGKVCELLDSELRRMKG